MQIERQGESEYCLNGFSVKQFSYHEDPNLGARNSMEDGHLIVEPFNNDSGLFCIFDGHGGNSVMQSC